MIEQVIQQRNLNRAYQMVCANKGAGGVDGMEISQLNAHLPQRDIKEGYQHVIDMDLKSFFDQVDHAILLELIHRKVKCRMTMKLLRKFLRAPMHINGRLRIRRKGVLQGSPVSLLLSNILLNELDRELEKFGHRYVRYADDISIYVRSKQAARQICNSIYLFLRDVLHLPINREKSGINRPSLFDILGYHFVPVFKKGQEVNINWW